MNSFESALKGRHYKWVAGSAGFGVVGGDAWRRLGRQAELQLLQEDLLIMVRLGIARQHDMAAVRGGQVDVDHLHGLELFQDRPGSEARRQGAQALLESDL